MRLCAQKLQSAMNTRRLDAAGLAKLLQDQGYCVDPGVVKKWQKALQPASDKIPLIEQVLGYEVRAEERPRRSFAHLKISTAA